MHTHRGECRVAQAARVLHLATARMAGIAEKRAALKDGLELARERKQLSLLTRRSRRDAACVDGLDPERQQLRECLSYDSRNVARRRRRPAAAQEPHDEFDGVLHLALCSRVKGKRALDRKWKRVSVTVLVGSLPFEEGGKRQNCFLPLPPLLERGLPCRDTCGPGPGVLPVGGAFKDRRRPLLWWVL